MKRSIQVGILVALVSAGVAQAQQATPRFYSQGGSWVEEISGTLAAARSLRVKTDMGSVHVQGGAQAITYTFRMRINTGSEDSARRRAEQFRVVTSRQGDRWVLAGECVRDDCPRNVGVEFTLNVPRDLESVMIETGGGNLVAAGLNGSLAVSTGGGSLSLDDIGGSASASTGGGNVTVGSVRSNLALATGGGNIHVDMAGGPLSISTGGGSVVVETASAGAQVDTGGGSIHVGRTGGALKANTGGGNIDVGEVGGAVIAETGGGGIHLGAARGAVRAETGGGNLELFGLGGGVRAETGSGGITVELVSGQPFSDSVVETGSGDVVVYLPANLRVTVRAAVEFCNGKGITSDFSELRVHTEGGEYGPHEVYADGSLNGGGPLLKIRTSNGSIQIRRGKK